MDKTNLLSNKLKQDKRNKIIRLKSNLIYSVCMSITKNTFNKILRISRNKLMLLKMIEVKNFWLEIEKLCFNSEFLREGKLI